MRKRWVAIPIVFAIFSTVVQGANPPRTLTANGILETVFAPIVTFSDLVDSLQKQRSQDRGKFAFVQAMEETFSRRCVQLLTFTAVTFGVYHFDQTYLRIRSEKYQQVTQPHMVAQPSQILHIDGLKREDHVKPYQAAEFLRRYGKSPGATYVETDSIKTFIGELEALDESVRLGEIPAFDVLEVGAHAGPGEFRIGKEDINLENIALLESAKLDNLFRPGASARFNACSLACNLPGDDVGTQLAARVTRALLRRGGTGFFATRDVEYYPSSTLNVVSGWYLATFPYHRGSSLYRDYSSASADAIEVIYSPERPENPIEIRKLYLKE